MLTLRKLSSCIFLSAAAVAISQSQTVRADSVFAETFDQQFAGVTGVQVNYDPSALALGTPGYAITPYTDGASYHTYVTDSGGYYYVGLQITDTTHFNTALTFTNLYFDVNPSVGDGADLLLEVQNQRAYTFGPSGQEPETDYTTASSGIEYVQDTTAGTVEVAIPNSFFYTAPLTVPYLPVTDGSVTLRDSQSFGYALSGGDIAGGDYARLGNAPVPLVSGVPLPKPALGGAMLLGACAFVGIIRRKPALMA